MPQELLYSIVIPIYNEQDNILPLTGEIEWVMHAYNGLWELVFVDDGSTDESPEILQKLVESKKNIRCIRLKKNYGQTSAFAAGIRACQGKWIISLDGDGQNDPRDIPLLIDASANFDLVTGIRRKRKDRWYKRMLSRAANFIRRQVLHDNTQDSGCSLKMYRRECFNQISLYKGMHRFLPALFQIEGYLTTEVVVNHRERRRGKSKYHLFNRGSSLVFDLMAVSWMRKRKLRYEIDRELS